MTLHHEFLHADTRTDSSEVGEDEAISRTLAFPWQAELEEANSRKECSPTVSVEYPGKTHVLWASVIEQQSEPLFLVCLQQKAPPTGLMRLLGSRERDVSVAERDGIALSALPDLFRLFYRSDFDAVANAIKKT